jgi:hypothetical protein
MSMKQEIEWTVLRMIKQTGESPKIIHVNMRDYAQSIYPECRVDLASPDQEYQVYIMGVPVMPDSECAPGNVRLLREREFTLQKIDP